jgi:hypothetical protein
VTANLEELMGEKAQAQVKPAAVSAGQAFSGSLQRKCACGTHTTSEQCDSCKGEGDMLQRKASSQAHHSEVPPIVHEVLRSPGQPLDAAMRAFFEPRFGRDFSHVRVHTDTRAAESARSVDALAYTVGNNVVFGSGQYVPHITAGRRLLAHELTHVLQQSGNEAMPQEGLRIGSPGDASEREADRFAERATGASVERIANFSSARGTELQRKCKPLPGGSTFEWEFEYDGCSGPKGLLGKVVNHVFDPNNPAGGKDTQFAEVIPSLLSGKPCDRHDECYQTCHYGDESAKEKCDKRMVEDMIDICFDAEGKESKKCFRWARKYRWILKQFGRKAYHDRQKEVCRCISKQTP